MCTKTALKPSEMKECSQIPANFRTFFEGKKGQNIFSNKLFKNFLRAGERPNCHLE